MDDFPPIRKKDAQPREPFRVKPFLRSKPGFNYDCVGKLLEQLDRLDREEDSRVPDSDKSQH